MTSCLNCFCRAQLEMLEDKLRELRLLALDPREYDDRTVTLSQLDSLRRELLGTARNSLRQVDFGKVLHCLSASYSITLRAAWVSGRLSCTPLMHAQSALCMK